MAELSAAERYEERCSAADGDLFCCWHRSTGNRAPRSTRTYGNGVCDSCDQERRRLSCCCRVGATALRRQGGRDSVATPMGRETQTLIRPPSAPAALQAREAAHTRRSLRCHAYRSPAQRRSSAQYEASLCQGAVLRAFRARRRRPSCQAAWGVVALVVGSGSDLSEEPADKDAEPVTLESESFLFCPPGPT